jgi:hypothetical protein
MPKTSAKLFELTQHGSHSFINREDETFAGVSEEENKMLWHLLA